MDYKQAFELSYERNKQANVRIGELLEENKGLKGEIENCYRDLKELQQDKRDLEKDVAEWRKLNRETNMEIGRYSQIILSIAGLTEALTKDLKALANAMLNGEENSQTEK